MKAGRSTARKISPAFKKCTYCSRRWQSREEFLADPATELIGYQINFENLQLGLFLFNHAVCKTTLAIAASQFRDLYGGPVLHDRLTGTEQCPGYCLHQDALEACPAQCECAYVRQVMQVIRAWKKSS